MSSGQEENTEYCGFSCDSLLRAQKRILQRILEFNEYNPEYSVVMLGKCIEILYNGRNDMINKQPQQS